VRSLREKSIISTIEMKKELITKRASGTRLLDLAAQYGKEAIKVANVVKGLKTLTGIRSPIVEEVGNLLMVWINEKQVAGDSMSEAIICEKVRQLCCDITKDTPGFSSKKNQVVIMLMNHNFQLVDSR
jgi:hypothetical protein